MATEIIPQLQIQPSELEAVLGNLDLYESQLAPIQAKVRSMEVKTAEQAREMKELVAQLKPIPKSAEADLQPFKVIVKRVSDFLQTRFLRVRNLAEQIHGEANRKLGEYEAEERLKAEAERRRLQAQIDKEQKEKAALQLKMQKEEADKRHKDAVAELKRQLKAGDISKSTFNKGMKLLGEQVEEEKEQAVEAAQSFAQAAPQIKVAPNTPKVSGTISRRNYRAECTDKVAFFVEAAKRLSTGDWSLVRYLSVNDQAISARARELRDSAALMKEIPFTKAWDDPTF